MVVAGIQSMEVARIEDKVTETEDRNCLGRTGKDRTSREAIGKRMRKCVVRTVG